VRRHLLDESVAPSQISECRPTVDAADGSDPGAIVALQAGSAHMLVDIWGETSSASSSSEPSLTRLLSRSCEYRESAR
jgi:hypothetical protein